MTKQPSIEEFTALQQALDAAQSQRDAVQSQRDSLAGENRILRVERDLLKERLNKMMRKIFAAKSEALGTDQKDMFFNEAELLAAATNAAPTQEETEAAAGTETDGMRCCRPQGRQTRAQTAGSGFATSRRAP